MRPVGQHALALRQLRFARELQLALLEVGEVRFLPFLEPDDEEVVADRERPGQRLLRREREGGLRDGVRDADALDDHAFGRRAQREQPGLLDARRGAGVASLASCVSLGGGKIVLSAAVGFSLAFASAASAAALARVTPCSCRSFSSASSSLRHLERDVSLARALDLA